MQEYDGMQEPDEDDSLWDIDEIIYQLRMTPIEEGLPEIEEDLVVAFREMADLGDIESVIDLIDVYSNFVEEYYDYIGEDTESAERDIIEYLALMAFLADYNYDNMEELFENPAFGIFYLEDKVTNFKLIRKPGQEEFPLCDLSATSESVELSMYDQSIMIMTPFYATEMYNREEHVIIPSIIKPGKNFGLAPVEREDELSYPAMELLVDAIESKHGASIMDYLQYPFEGFRN